MIISLNQVKKQWREMKLFDFLFKSKEEREKEKKVNDVLKRTDDFIERTENLLGKMK